MNEILKQTEYHVSIGKRFPLFYSKEMIYNDADKKLRGTCAGAAIRKGDSNEQSD